MLQVPDRDTLAALVRAVDAVAPSVILGFARTRPDADVDLLYVDPWGIGAYVVRLDELTRAVAQGASGTIVDDVRETSGVLGWQVTRAGARFVTALDLPHQPEATRLWIGFRDSPNRGLDWGALASTAAGILATAASQGDESARLRRLELAAGLLPALTEALDIRDVFNRLSEISRQALPHDMLALGLFSDSLVRRGFLGLGSKESLRFSKHADSFADFNPRERLYQKV